MTRDRQLWRCSHCQLERAWGTCALPDDAEREAWLDCRRCDKTTLHTFVRHEIGRPDFAWWPK